MEPNPMTESRPFEYPAVIDEICQLGWRGLSADDMVSVAWAYYFFSIQFRENLKIARGLYPHDEKLAQLEREECDTDNLSPWPGVTEAGERVNHDEFMRRTIALLPIDPARERRLRAIGESYLADMRRQDAAARAASIASYEDGGLETVFTAILTFDGWEQPMLKAFRHFLAQHVMFDSDPAQGHGALSRHIPVDDRVLPMWLGFKRLFVESVPSLAEASIMMAAE